MSGKSAKGADERREWDLNPRGLRPTIFKTVPFGRSGIPPEKEATRPCADAAADRNEQAESKGEKQRRGEHESPSRFAADAFERHIGTKGTNL
jgi:hypothetical protein